MGLNNLSDWDRSGTLSPYQQSSGTQGINALSALLKIMQQQQQDAALRKAAGGMMGGTEVPQGVDAGKLFSDLAVEKNKPMNATGILDQLELKETLKKLQEQTNVPQVLGNAVPIGDGSTMPSPNAPPLTDPLARPPQFIPGKTNKYGVPEDVENPDFELYQKKRIEDLQPPTDAQTVSAGFAKRMEQAEEPIGKIKGLGLGKSLLGLKLGPLGVPNWAKPSEAQTFDQAKRNFVNAVLRKESGAVISPEEFKNADLQYFPQPGDKPEVIKQKAENRRLALESLKQSAGKAYTQEVLNEDVATKILQEAAGDKNKAREIARQRGYKF